MAVGSKKALEISLDYLIELTDVELDPIILKRIQGITSLSDEDCEHVFKVVDALIRELKLRNKKAQLVGWAFTNH
jgi:phage-related protein